MLFQICIEMLLLYHENKLIALNHPPCIIRYKFEVKIIFLCLSWDKHTILLMVAVLLTKYVHKYSARKENAKVKWIALKEHRIVHFNYDSFSYFHAQGIAQTFLLFSYYYVEQDALLLEFYVFTQHCQNRNMQHSHSWHLFNILFKI